MHIWFNAPERKLWKTIKRITPVFIVFFFCWFLLYSLFAYAATIKQLFNTGDIAATRLHAASFLWHRVSIALLWIDYDLAKSLQTMNRILTHTANKTSYLPQEEKHIRHLFKQIQDNTTIQKILPASMNQYYPLLQWLAEQQDDILSLLGNEEEQSYLVVLQNVAEKRPNGWFFGSFALIKVKGGIVSHLEILDSYLPWYDNPDTYITWPDWLYQFLPERQIYFVWANKVWFTYHDGPNIKTLYEKSYPWQQIRGVIFLRTDMFEEILPWFSEQLREWQFVNASIDLIRGEERRWKKELYLTSSQQYFQDNAWSLLQWMVSHLPALLNKRYINMYFEDVSWGFHTFLRKNHLTTRFEEYSLYSWNSNISFNKTDRFVEKSMQCKDSNGTIQLASQDDIIDIKNLQPWPYSCLISYTLDIPAYYKNYISQLEKEYEIELWQRERHILWLQETRATRWVIFTPFHIDILSIQWETETSNIFDTPFAHGAMYTAKLTGNNDTQTVSLDLYVNEIE